VSFREDYRGQKINAEDYEGLKKDYRGLQRIREDFIRLSNYLWISEDKRLKKRTTKD